mmetsp:Transcript_70615/g.199316  ORF Transcript_70615/g.199316 Transcript_70615/m.199316 type:complete len:181 (-) Transcript_70615:21-563(-)
MADQIKQARKVIRDFVFEMREGKRMMVLSPTGQLKATTCSLNKKLNTFRIVRAGKIRRIPLTDIQGIHAGMEPEGLSTPLDDLCATVVVAPDGQLVTFRFEHINARDTFVMCMMLFANSLAGAQEGEEWADDGNWEEGGGEQWAEGGNDQDDAGHFTVEIEEAGFGALGSVAAAGRVDRL